MYKVMIVEDEMLVRMGIKASTDWEKFGMKVIADVSNGQQAWEKYEKERPDVILTDIRMPVMDGLALIEKIRAKDKKTQFIILTCLEEFGLVQKALHLGVTRYILKLTMTKHEMEEVLKTVKEKLDSENIMNQNKAEVCGDDKSIQQTVLQNYIVRRSLNDEAFEDAVKKYDIRLEPDNLVIFALEINHYEAVKNRFRDETGRILRGNVVNIINEILAGHQTGMFFHADESRFFLVLSSGGYRQNEDTEGRMPDYENTVEHLRRAIDTYLGFSLTIVTSAVRSGYKQLPLMYLSCIRYLEYRQLFCLEHLAPTNDSKTEKLHRETVQVIQYIKSNYDKRITVEKLAEIAKLSPNYLCSFFKKETGSNIVEFINMIRIEKAKEFMQNTDMKNYEIAEKVGFMDESYFARSFKKVTGLRPMEYKGVYRISAIAQRE